MPKPLRSSENSPPPVDPQFKHFGVLNDGQQSRSSIITSVTLNILIALIVIVIGAAAKKTMDHTQKLVTLTEPIPLKPIEPIKPKILPKLPPPPKVVTPPKIVIPETKIPEPPKVPEVKMTQPAPVVTTPAPPKQVIAPPAPKVVNLGRAQAASVMANNHPAPVALGQQNNPIAPSNRPATSAVNLGQRGMAGMPASNTGMGATQVSLGSGSPSGTNMAGTGTHAVQGVKLGVAGGTGPLNSTGRVAGPVNLGQVQQVALPHPVPPATATARSAPKVIFKPKPEYTAEAIQLHLEGTVAVRLKVTADGGVQVLGVTSGLGHGLDQAAVRAVQGTRFKPATDAAGAPVDWEGVVNVAFQLAG